MFIFCLSCCRLSSLSRDVDKQSDGGTLLSFLHLFHFSFFIFHSSSLLIISPMGNLALSNSFLVPYLFVSLSSWLRSGTWMQYAVHHLHILHVFHHQTHGSIPPRCLKTRSFKSLAYVPRSHENMKQLMYFMTRGGFDPPVLVSLGASYARDRYLMERCFHFTRTPCLNTFLLRIPVSTQRVWVLDPDSVFYHPSNNNFFFFATRPIWRNLHSLVYVLWCAHSLLSTVFYPI